MDSVTQIVIDISDKDYKNIKPFLEGKTINGGFNLFKVLEIIKNGTPLPKGHGRIGDLDKLIRGMKERNDDNGGEPLNAVDRGYDLAYQHMVEEVEECVFIEADKIEG